MWFGTQNGLSRFDGVHFKTFPLPRKNNNGPSRDDIASLAIDREGRLWVAGGKGLFVFDKRQEKLIPFIDSLSNTRQIVFDNQNRLWFISHQLVCQYDIITEKLTTFDTDQFFEAKALCTTKDGTVWIADTKGYLQRFNTHKNVFEKYDLYSHSPNTLFKTFSTLAADQEGNIYIGTQNQELKKFDVKTLSYTDLTPNKENQDIGVIYTILPIDEKEIWFGAEKGLFILNKESNKISKITKSNLTPYSLSDDAVLTLYKDREAGVWAGTYFGGLNYSPKQYYNFLKIYPDKSKGATGANVVREIVQDSLGNIWMALEESRIAKYNPKKNEIEHFTATGLAGNLPFSNVHGLLVDENNLWIGTHYHGIDIMDLQTGKIKKHYKVSKNPKDIASNFVVSFLKTSEGTIYIATASGLYRYNANDDQFFIETKIPTGAFISCLIEDKNGMIWVGTGQGLYKLNVVTGESLHYKHAVDAEVEKAHILSLLEDSAGNIWATTEGSGLWKLSKDLVNFKQYTTGDGLPSNVCFKVIEDDNKTIWISTYKGLAHLLPANDSLIVFTKEDGLLNDQFNYNSGYKDKEGRLYFGSTKGLIVFDPDVRQNKQINPHLFITDFQVNDTELYIDKKGPLHQSLQYTNTITLKHNQSTFSIDFAALGYTSPERIQYSYSMLGISSEWVHLDRNRRVYFTDLKPGNYIFRIRASSFNFASVQEKELKISIMPPIWATSWAYLLYAVLIIALALYILRSYLAVKESEKAKEVVDAKIEFFTNIAHEIKTPLTLIKGPLDNLNEIMNEIPSIRPDVTMMAKNTERLMNLAEQVLDFRQTQLKSYQLNFTETNVSEVVKENFDNFQSIAKKRNLHYTISLPATEIVTLADKEALQKICTNLFSNAIKYAETKVAVSLVLEKEDKMILIAFSNDGPVIPTSMKEKIFEPFFRLKNTKNIKGSGIGLALSRSLAELHNGKLYLNQSVENINIFVAKIPHLSDNKSKS